MISLAEAQQVIAVRVRDLIPCHEVDATEIIEKERCSHGNPHVTNTIAKAGTIWLLN
jgi:hypothetical protein